jgi:hypothetical protein
VAAAAGVRYAASWFGRAAVLFPVGDRAGALVAVQGRYLAEDAQPKARSAGAAGRGVFATAGAWETKPLLLVEAPIDALSLAACGFPALATLGCRLSDALPRACAFEEVLVATDADRAGDEAARQWQVALRSRSARVERLRPIEAWGKDWNEVLQRAGGAALRAELARAIGAPPMNETPYVSGIGIEIPLGGILLPGEAEGQEEALCEPEPAADWFLGTQSVECGGLPPLCPGTATGAGDPKREQAPALHTALPVAGWEAVRDAWRRMGQETPPGAIAWAARHRPDLMERLDQITESDWVAAFAARDRDALHASITDFHTLIAQIAAAFAAAPAQPSLFSE